MASWQAGTPGVLRLPSGALVRGRGLGQPMPAGPEPEFGLYLQAEQPEQLGWDSRWVRWRDYWLPADREDFLAALRQLLQRAPVERVEIACTGGLGRTGTALACLAVLDGVPRDRALAYVRDGYSQRAVETPWQRWFIRRVG